MKQSLLTLFMAFAAMAATSASGMTDTDDSWRGDNYLAKDGSLATFAVPDNYPFIEHTPTFKVTVDGKASVGIYNDFNYWGGNVQFGYFNAKEGKSVRVTVTAPCDMSNTELLPLDAAISNVKRDRMQVSFTIDRAGQYITLVPGGNYKGDVLHLFCNKMEEEPTLSDSYDPDTHYDKTTSTYYFGPGYHDLKKVKGCDGRISISGGQRIYVAPGAVLNGQLHMTKSDIGNGRARIFGQGMVVNDKTTGRNSLSADYTDDGLIEGILVHTHRKHCWQTIFSNCNNLTVKDIKIISTRYASTDGIDVIASTNCSFDNIFVRSSDDCVAIKGLGNLPPAESKPQHGLRFTHMQLWNDCNNAFGIGAETRASEFRDISLKDSHILFSYDDPEFHERLDERSAMNICALHGTYFSNITFENIHVNRCERLIGMGFKNSFWFGSIQGDQSTEGGISDVTFRNITCPNNSGSTIANNIWIYGWLSPDTPTKYVKDITFENVKICGETLENENDPHIITTNKAVSHELVTGLRFVK